MELKTGMKFYFSSERTNSTTFIIKVIRDKILEENSYIILVIFEKQWDMIEELNKASNEVLREMVLNITYKEGQHLIDIGWWHLIND